MITKCWSTQIQYCHSRKKYIRKIIGTIILRMLPLHLLPSPSPPCFSSVYINVLIDSILILAAHTSPIWNRYAIAFLATNNSLSETIPKEKQHQSPTHPCSESKPQKQTSSSSPSFLERHANF